MHHILSERGDTLVEVMLSIAVVGMVIGLSYSTANRAVKTGRAAQEQTEALKLAQTQLERLKSVAESAPASVFTSGVYCIDAGLVVVPASSTAAYTARCKGQGGGQLYEQSLQYVAASNDTFTARVTWVPATTIAATNTVSVSYRLHKQ